MPGHTAKRNFSKRGCIDASELTPRRRYYRTLCKPLKSDCIGEGAPVCIDLDSHLKSFSLNAQDCTEYGVPLPIARGYVEYTYCACGESKHWVLIRVYCVFSVIVQY